ncbi:MAG: TIGR00269 family protein [Candidatus Woesearchaeota archaeon]
MQCSKCESKAIYKNPTLCKDHFIDYFESKVEDTIKENNMIKKSDSICVAASGGKDSLSVLHILWKMGFNVEALAIDEGIKGYRDETIKHLQKFCTKRSIKLHIKSYKEEVGKTLNDVVPLGRHACHICGTFRRNLLNKYSLNYDLIATGHNLDDESQAVLMNLLKAQTSLFMRQGPITKKISGFTRKIKPLYLMKEKEVMIYSFLKGFNTPYNECPYAKESFRAQVRDMLNDLEHKNPGTKENIIKKYLSLRKDNLSEDVEIKFCSSCGSPCSAEICKACRLKSSIVVSS